MSYQKDIELEKRWVRLLNGLSSLTKKRPKDLNSVLFLIGVQELGQGPQNFSKEEKQDLMHIAICKVLSLSGYYRLLGQDESGWPIWELRNKLPRFKLDEQENLIKMHVIEYFEKEKILNL